VVTSFRSIARWSRPAVVAAISLMFVALLGVVWATNRGVNAASETVIRGEAEVIHASLRSRIFEPGDATLADRLAATLQQHAPDGLRYLAAYEQDGTLLAEAGVPADDPVTLAAWMERATTGVPQSIADERVRVMYRKKARDPATAPPPTTTDPTKEPRRGPWATLVELEPQVVKDLRATSTWLLGIGGLAAATLLLLVIVLVRWSLRRESAVKAIAEAHHLATLGQMSAVLAHEIRNPLASLKGNAQLLAAQLPAGEKVRTKADLVVREATRLETLSNDLLEFARAGEIRLDDVDPVGMVHDIAATLGSERVAVESTGAPRQWPLDGTRMRQVLVNLLENALEMSEGTVEVRVSREDRSLVYAIRDHGPGIADADLEHIFEPFFTRRVRGTGLGLAVARRLVDLHGGTITASNATGGGAVFRVSLPRK
jgi:two-component system sensor histidine kinase HydH